ncbi:MAG: UxaA family hydrolase [Planctomycetes bacterium]|nr:UxaA family hydrolase [Planctomycetota bacterium]MCP4772109.1 UxaA family hydrolase [Planctomycetota bacterium]MCP4862204.1 UxaA family hydrolase [Planctomycetota bacterium]
MTSHLAVLRIHPNDNICVALHPMEAGTEIVCGSIQFVLAHDIRLGAKLALMPMTAGSTILKFGEPIGLLTDDVELGGYVHSHNLKSEYMQNA